MYRFLLTPRWVIGHTLVIVLVVSFTALGSWQLSRRAERMADNDLIARRQAAPPVELRTALEGLPPGTDPGLELEYRRVVASGTYDPEREVLVRSRTLNGEPGFWVVTPLTRGDSAVLVTRGFVPLSFDSPPVEGALPPFGRVEVEGRVRASAEPPRFGPEDRPEGVLKQVFWVNIERLQAQMPFQLEPVSIELTGQTPVQSGALPVMLPAPALDEGPHLGYAVQWFSFAIIGLVGYWFLVRRAGRRPSLR